MDNFLTSVENDIQKYIIKKKKNILSYILEQMGVNTSFPICYPIKMLFEDINTPNNVQLLDSLADNPIINKYFNCRSLKATGKNDKKRVQNVIKQMANECGLNIQRTPYTCYNELTGEKITKQYYIIGA